MCSVFNLQTYLLCYIYVYRIGSYFTALTYSTFSSYIAPLIEPQSTTVPVLVESDVTSRTMTIHTPVVRDSRGEIRYICTLCK